MKKLLLLVGCAMLFASPELSAQRYLNEVFTDVTVTPNVVYGKNYEILTGAPVLKDLKLDIYEPTGDTAMKRPLVVYLHTGSFLPILFNQTTTGARNDSSNVEMCRRFAKRGYVAVTIDYRLGWNPAATGAGGQDIRTGSLLQAVYRAIQDAKSAVRYLKMTADSMGNVYKIDTNRIVLCGQGSGGYIALAYATLNNFATEVAGLPSAKFISGSDQPAYGFMTGTPFINQAIMGDFDGLGGNAAYNYPNHPTYSSKVNMVVNMGGALGDSTWLEAGDVPMVGFHVTNDPFAPYTRGMVVVPTTGANVVYVAGSYDVINRANRLGNNDVFNIPYNDVYTTRANMVNNGHEGLFPFVEPDPNVYTPSPFHGQAGPWEWYSKSDLYALGALMGKSNGAVDTIYGGSLLTNPTMSKTKAMAYIDTIQGYLAPRMVQALGLPGMYITGVEKISDTSVSIEIAPNPSSDNFEIVSRQSPVTAYQLCDLTGRVIISKTLKDVNSFTVSGKDLSKGIYLLTVHTGAGKAVSKLVVN